MKDKKKIVFLVSVIIIICVLLGIVIFNSLKNHGNFNDTDENQNEILQNNVKKNPVSTIVDLNFLKNEECSYLDFYRIEVVSPELFSIYSCSSETNSYSLRNKNGNILDNNLQSGDFDVYDSFFVDSLSESGKSKYKTKIYDRKGNYLFSEELITVLSNNLIFLDNANSITFGKIYNALSNTYSDEIKILQYINENIILIEDKFSNVKIINGQFETILELGNNDDEYILLNDQYLFNKTKESLYNFKTNKKIKKKYDEYYPFYNEYVEVCNNDTCGIVNMDNGEIIVPIKYSDTFIDFEYDEVNSISSRKFYVSDNIIIVDDKDVYNFKGKKLFELKEEAFIQTLDTNFYIVSEYNEDETENIKVYDSNGKLLFEDIIVNDFDIEFTDYNSYFSYDNSKSDENSKFGIIDVKGNILVDFKYDDIDLYDDFYILELNDEQGIFKYNGEELLPFGNYDIKWQGVGHGSIDDFEILLIQNLDTDDIKMLVTLYE